MSNTNNTITNPKLYTEVVHEQLQTNDGHEINAILRIKKIDDELIPLTRQVYIASNGNIYYKMTSDTTVNQYVTEADNKVRISVNGKKFVIDARQVATEVRAGLASSAIDQVVAGASYAFNEIFGGLKSKVTAEPEPLKSFTTPTTLELIIGGEYTTVSNHKVVILAKRDNLFVGVFENNDGEVIGSSLWSSDGTNINGSGSAASPLNILKPSFNINIYVYFNRDTSEMKSVVFPSADKAVINSFITANAQRPEIVLVHQFLEIETVL